MPETRVTRSLDGLGEAFAFLEEEFARHGVDPETAYTVRFAAEELLTNMVRHNVPLDGTGGDFIRLGLAITDEGVDLRLTDSGVEPFDDAAAGQVDFDRPLEEREPGGLGVYMVRQMVDHLTYEYDEGDMLVSVKKRRNRTKEVE